jgi:hypothetical protein
MNDVIEPKLHKVHGYIQFLQYFEIRVDRLLSRRDCRHHRPNYLEFWLYDIFLSVCYFAVGKNQLL